MPASNAYIAWLFDSVGQVLRGEKTFEEHIKECEQWPDYLTDEKHAERGFYDK